MLDGQSALHTSHQCNLNTGDRLPFPSLFESPSLDLSVVIPAYNEEDRLPVMLEESVDYLVKNFGDKFEIILVDDGSKDKTTSVALVRLCAVFKIKYCSYCINVHVPSKCALQLTKGQFQMTNSTYIFDPSMP